MFPKPVIKIAPPPRSPKARVLVVDDHALVREGLANLINRQNDLICCGRAENLRAAEHAVKANAPDLVLVDLRLGDEDGMAFVRHVRSRDLRPRLLVLSQLDETVYAEQAFRAGADGYIMKEQAATGLLEAIRKVLSGDLYFSPKVATLAVRRMFGVTHVHAGAGCDSAELTGPSLPPSPPKQHKHEPR